jgi:uncharacterized protein (TIGR00251 family)
MMIDVTPHQEGTILPVRAKPGAKRNELIDERDSALLVGITAPPEHGKANEAIIELLASSLGLRRAQIELVGGHTAKIKRFLIRQLRPEDLLTRIEAVLTPTVYEPVDPDV